MAAPAPGLLTIHGLARLQSAAGNRVVGRLVTGTVQRSPVRDKPDSLFCHDKEHPDVKLKVWGEDYADMYFTILNEGPYQNQLVYFETDAQKYYVAKLDPGVKGGIDYTPVLFDISAVSTLKAPVPTAYRSIGEAGRGVAYVAAETTLHTSGLVSCVGWLLYNDRAAYMAHILVKDPRTVRSDGAVREQVGELVRVFAANTGAPPTDVTIKVDAGHPAYADKEGVWQSGWMRELEPGNCRAQWIRGAGELEHVVPVNTTRSRTEWQGAPIKLTY